MSNEVDKEKPLVVITHPDIPTIAIEMLSTKCRVRVLKKNPPELSDILKKINDCSGILWASGNKLNEDTIKAAGAKLKVISTMSAGYDYVDVETFKLHKIPLGFTPKVLDDAVAELAIGLCIAASRRFHEGRQKIETLTWENWKLNWMCGQNLRSSNVGFVGFGNIGHAIAKRIQGFEVKNIFYYARNESPYAAQVNAIYVTFDELLKKSDTIFVTCPLTPKTRYLINDKAFNKMKSICVLVNISRGEVVEKEALYKALKNNKIFAAGIDVCYPEPLPTNDPLLSLPNLIITPHIGSATVSARSAMALLAAKNILAGLEGKPLLESIY